MIQFTLRCENGHESDSWFKSSAAYDALEKAGHLACAVCGSASVTKALMAPRVNLPARTEETATMMQNPPDDVQQAIEALRRKVEDNADYVGPAFAEEARAMHLGDKPERSIYGEARLDQAKSLIEDGVPLMPLPFRPKQKLT